jgi:class 3 adenylate cyclase/tetratricopeptide (TPR) repeat protein
MCLSCGRGNPADASFCMGCGAKFGATATARESRRTVTALFCDLVGSTSLGERHDPEVLRPLLDRYFAEAREAVERHGGRVEKFIGDAVAAVFGLPAAHEDDALRAVRAGREIQDRLARLRDGSPIPLEARVGITTGEVLVPGGGAPLIGDAMNTASRLQSGAAPGEVLVGEPTWRLVRDAVAAEPAPSLAAKGKAEPVRAWRVLAVASGSPPRSRRLGAPMVGRDRESAALANAYRHVADDGACRLFTVLGVAGAGKSRLVEEFLGAFGDGAEVLRGRCLSYGEGITWLPLAEALRPTLGLAEFSSPDDVALAIERAALGEGPDAAAVAAGLGGLLGLPGSGSAEQTAWAVRRLLESRARSRPVVLVLDDIHWAEPALLDLVEHLAERAEGPLLLLCMARPELLDDRPGWGAVGLASEVVRLDALLPPDADALADALLGGAVPPEARERIASAAGGNPLFTEEVVRLLVDEGLLVRDGGAWAVVGDLTAVRVPPTVAALLSSRLDRLPEPERELLEAASVEGQSFSAGALEALLPESSRHALPGLLLSLARRELVVSERRQGPGRVGYRFRHLLIRDAAYDAIPKASRSHLHLAYADWLERAAGDALAEHREVLGHHLTQAHRYREELGLPDDPRLRMRAARALGEAGARAYDELGDARGAVRLLETAVELGMGSEDAARWDERLWSIGFALHQRPVDGRSRDANRAVYGDEVADLLVARDTQYRVEFADPAAIDRTAGRAGDLRALELYRAHGARHLEIGALLRLDQGAYYAGDPASAEVWAREALRIAEDLGWRDPMQWAAGDVMNALAAGPEPLSRVVAESSVLVDRWAGRPASRYALIGRADARALMGDVAGARADVDEASRLRDALGLPWDLDELWVGPSLEIAAGDLPAAAEACREVLAQLPDEDGQNRNWMLGVYARVLLDLGLDDEARVAVEPLEASEIIEHRVTHRSLRARLFARAGEVEAALASMAEADALVGPTGLAVVKADVALDRARVLLGVGRAAQATARAGEALRRYRVKEHEVGARAALTVLGRDAEA